MTANHRTATSALLVLSLAAAGAPIASAMPTDPAGPATAKTAPTAVYSRPDRAMIPTAPSTTAGTAANNGSQSTPISSGPRSHVVFGGVHDSGTAAPAVIRVTSPSTGFDWGDAGIGAAGGVALSMLGLGGALAVSQNRARRARRQAAPTG